MDNHTGAGGGTRSTRAPPCTPRLCSSHLPTLRGVGTASQAGRQAHTWCRGPDPQPGSRLPSALNSSPAVADGSSHLRPEHSARPARGMEGGFAATRSRQLEGPRVRKGLLLLGSTVTSGGSKTGHHPQPSDRAPCVAWSLAGLSECLLRKDEVAEAQGLHCPPNLGLDLNSKEHFVSRGRTPAC